MTGTALVLARDALPYRWAPSLVAWWTGANYTAWHLAVGARTRCGRLIPTGPGARLTRRHQQAAHVCAACLRPTAMKSPAAAVTATGRGADAVEPGAGANLGPAREGRKP